MKFSDLIYETTAALDSNRVRSLLTVLGIVIGISAVIAMTALIGGIKNSLTGELGLDQARAVEFGVDIERDITIDDLQALEQMMPEYESLTGTTTTNANVSNDSKTMDVFVSGVLANYFKVAGAKCIKGSTFSETDERSGAQIVLLDQNVVKELFGDPDADVVGKTVQIQNVEYTVTGVIESSSMSGSGRVFMPFTTCAQRLTGTTALYGLSGLATEDADMDAIADATTEHLATYFNISEDEVDEKIYVWTMKSMIDELDTMMASFQLLMTAVASVSLLVGGIGIMNMMLTNVTERIREIGLRKALGARRSDVTMQFLLESIILCVSGGIIGIVLGYAGSFALTQVAGNLASIDAPITPVIDVKSVMMATGICVGIGILFGYYPARQAARLDPVESLHYQ